MRVKCIATVFLLAFFVSKAPAQGCSGGGFGYGGPAISFQLGAPQQFGGFQPSFGGYGVPQQAYGYAPPIPFGFSGNPPQGLPYGSGYANPYIGVSDSSSAFAASPQQQYMPYAPQSFAAPWQGQGRWVYCANGQCR
jgi:hypothetical protein